MSAVNSLVNIDVINKGSHSIILTSYIVNGTLISYQAQVDVKRLEVHSIIMKRIKTL